MKRYLWIVLIIAFWFLLVGCGGDPVCNDPATPPPTVDAAWQPPQTPGLRLILDQANRREIFSAIRIPDGLMYGDYDLDVGGPTVQTWDGKTLTIDGQFPECESVYNLYMPEDGMVLLTNEHYGIIRKRVSPGVWEIKYKMSSTMDLMFLILRAGNNLYANWFTYGKGRGGIVRSDLNGNDWTEVSHYTNKAMIGMFSDGSNIYLAGATGSWPGAGYPILTDFGGNIMSGRPDCPNYKYQGIAKFKDLFILGTTSYVSSGGKANDSHIDVFDGSKNITVWTNERPVIPKMEVYENKVYAVVTWDWDADSNKTTLLMSSPDGYNWNIVVEIPCPHIIGMSFADDGIYLMGGRYRDFGRVYFWKF